MILTNNSGGQASFKGFCDHCSNTTFQTIVAVESTWSDKSKFSSFTLTTCTICHGMTLRKHEGTDLTFVKVRSVNGTEEVLSDQLWPPAAAFSSDVPERIRIIYEEAKSVKRKSRSSFVVQLRRAFEALAKDRQAKGHTLNHQIQWLIEQEQIPKVFAEMMDVARMIGNAGAHDSDKDISDEDVEHSDYFFKAIVEYLYIAPALLKKAQAKKAKSQENAGFPDVSPAP